MEPTLRAKTLTGYFRVARRHGLDPLALLHEVGIEATWLANPDYRIPVASACQLLETAAERAHCASFGLEMAELRQKDDAGAVGILLAHKRTLRDALQVIVQYRQLANDPLGVHIETTADLVSIREEVLATGPVQPRQATELAVGIMTKICRGLLGPQWNPRSVNFMHAAPADRRFHRRFFNCPLAFDSDINGIVCTADDLDYPNPAADPQLVRFAETLARPVNEAGPKKITLDVRRAIYVLLPLEQASIDEVAAYLHLSTRTLQRQLQEVDSDFSQLLGHVRQELAVRYLANARFPIGRIASMLGFSRQASFTRWFASRFNVTPRAWRKDRAPPTAPGPG